MSSAGEQAQQIIAAIARVLDAGALAALVTVVAAPQAIGAKLLVEQTGARTGTTGDAGLDEGITAHPHVFLRSHAEAQTDRQSVGKGKGVDLGGRRIIKNKNKRADRRAM